jgi:hypothetical protein
MKPTLQGGSQFVAIVLLTTIVAISANCEVVPPWESTNPSGLPNTKYWGYDFDDGALPPTITSEGGNSGQPNDPVWTITGYGDVVSILAGALGIHTPTQPSEVTLRLDVPNTYNSANIKYFWFAFDYSGTAPVLDFGTDDTRSVLVPGSLTYTDNTVGNHIEGYVNFDPQPGSEWIEMTLTAGVGETNWIDNLQTGASCVPEPASFSMIALGGLGTWLARRKKQRRLRSRKKEAKFEELTFTLPFLAEETGGAPIGGSREYAAYRIK